MNQLTPSHPHTHHPHKVYPPPSHPHTLTHYTHHPHILTTSHPHTLHPPPSHSHTLHPPPSHSHTLHPPPSHLHLNNGGHSEAGKGLEEGEVCEWVWQSPQSTVHPRELLPCRETSDVIRDHPTSCVCVCVLLEPALYRDHLSVH